ncbi:sensor histidine kinase [Planobispora longispora]|uniref:Anti-sigma regulatory factor n=1 Tax=Planobispora longispora TaxID=28887 RepID=A0A8J3W928_9ACTN|nr:sensor histidine kinase [Planobispora longispora]GIH80525.1 anti-sigma regulatory factor [Planobispora longispora]
MTASPTQRVPELVHHALIYDSDEAFLAATAGFCLDGLAAGDKVLAVTTAANIGLLKDGLGQISDGVQFVTAQDWYDTPGRTLAAYNRYVNAHKTHHRRVRIIGEPVWHGRSPAEEAEWTRYESVINAAFEGSPAWIVCPYDERVLPERVVSDARRTHPQLLTGDTARDSRVYTDPAAFTHASDHLPLPLPPAGTHVESTFDADLGRTRRLVSAWATALGLADGTAGRLVLAVNEVVVNAVRHGGGHGRIRLWADHSVIRCDVTDSGRLRAPFPGYLPPDPAADRGHGLWVVRQLCDLLEIRGGEHGTQVRLHLSRA